MILSHRKWNCRQCNLQPATSHSGTLVKSTQWNGEGHSYNSQAKLMVLFVCAKSLLAQNKLACSQQQLDMVTLMSRFANNALFGCEVRVRVWIREQRSKEDRRHCQAFVGNPGHLLLFVHKSSRQLKLLCFVISVLMWPRQLTLHVACWTNCRYVLNTWKTFPWHGSCKKGEKYINTILIKKIIIIISYLHVQLTHLWRLCSTCNAPSQIIQVHWEDTFLVSNFHRILLKNYFGKQWAKGGTIIPWL